MHNINNIALYSADSELDELVRKKSEQYQIELTTQPDDFTYYLAYASDNAEPGFRCSLHKTGKHAPGALLIDFTQGKAAHRRQFGGGRKQTLARAVGIKASYNPRILDTSAGLGRDAFVLACLGCEVTLLERNPVIYELLQNGLAHARLDNDIGEIVNSRLRLIFSDAKQYLQQLDTPLAFDTIYLDPMYPVREKSAQVKKEMQFFHDIAGSDVDADQTLEMAIALKPKRVVVKRPSSAKPLANRAANANVSSKNTRYDIYT